MAFRSRQVHRPHSAFLAQSAAPQLAASASTAGVRGGSKGRTYTPSTSSLKSRGRPPSPGAIERPCGADGAASPSAASAGAASLPTSPTPQRGVLRPSSGRPAGTPAVQVLSPVPKDTASPAPRDPQRRAASPAHDATATASPSRLPAWAAVQRSASVRAAKRAMAARVQAAGGDAADVVGSDKTLRPTSAASNVAREMSASSSHRRRASSSSSAAAVSAAAAMPSSIEAASIAAQKPLLLVANGGSADGSDTLARPLSAGLQVAAAYASVAELASRQLLAPTSSSAISYISHADVDALYDARCRDQHSEPNGERRIRFHALMSEACRGQRLCLRQAGLGPESVVAMARMLMENEHVTHLDISGNNVNVKGAKALARLLTENDTLCVLQLQSANLGEGCRVLANALKTNETLTALDLSGIGGVHRNNIWGPATSSIAEMLSVTRVLAYLNLGSCGLQRGAAEIIAGARHTPSLTHIGLSGNHAGDHVCPQLAALLQHGAAPLAHLDLSQNDITARGCRQLAKGLGSGGVPAAALRHLVLSGNDISGPGLVELAAGLAAATSLHTLDVARNPLCRMGTDDDGFKIADSAVGLDALFRVLRTEGNELANLHLEDCDIKQLPAAASLVDSMGHGNSNLRSLNISGNLVGDEGFARIGAAMAATPTLRAIKMIRCGASVDGLRRIADAVESHDGLEKLSLLQGGFIDWHATGLVAAIDRSPSLLAVDLPQEPRAAVAHRLEANKVAQLKRCGPLLAEARRANYVQARNIAQTREMIATEMKAKERLTEASRLRRERQKAQVTSFRAEIAALEEERDRRQHDVDTARFELQSVDDTVSEKRKSCEANFLRLKQQLERQENLRKDAFEATLGALSRHYELHPPSDVEPPSFIKVNVVKDADGILSRQLALHTQQALAAQRAAAAAAAATSNSSNPTSPRAASSSQRRATLSDGNNALSLGASVNAAAMALSTTLRGGHNHAGPPKGAVDPEIKRLEGVLLLERAAVEKARVEHAAEAKRIEALEVIVARGGRPPTPPAPSKVGLHAVDFASKAKTRAKKGLKKAGGGAKRKK